MIAFIERVPSEEHSYSRAFFKLSLLTICEKNLGIKYARGRL